MNPLDVDVILLDWGGTLSRIARQNEAWEQGARDACDRLAQAGWRHPAPAVELLRVVHEAEQTAQRDPDHREVDMHRVFDAWTHACGWHRPDHTLRDEVIRIFGRRWVGCLDPIGGVAETLAALRERGYRLGLASNCWTPAEFCHAELRRHAYDAYFHGVTFSCEVGFRKPAARFFHAALAAAVGKDRAAPPPQRVLFVGDTPACDVVGPAALGMRTALVRNPDRVPTPGEFERVRPDFVIDHVRGLLTYLPAARC